MHVFLAAVHWAQTLPLKIRDRRDPIPGHGSSAGSRPVIGWLTDDLDHLVRRSTVPLRALGVETG